MKILITGGSGFIGTYLADGLKKKGYFVSILDIKKTKIKGVNYQNVNVLDLKGVIKAAKGFDVIYHLAAEKLKNCYSKNYLNVNTGGTLNVLEAARLNNVKRVILASTVWVYDTVLQENVDEAVKIDINKVNHPFILSKILSEIYCNYYQKFYRLPYTVLRYDVTYGHGSNTVIPSFVKAAIKYKKITIYGSGNEYRNFVYISDLINGNILALNGIAENQIYNLSGPQSVTIAAAAKAVQIALKPKICYNKNNGYTFHGKVVSNLKAKTDLGWTPKIGYIEGIKLCINRG